MTSWWPVAEGAAGTAGLDCDEPPTLSPVDDRRRSGGSAAAGFASSADLKTGTSQIEAVTHAWERALAAHDLDALLACYGPDATHRVYWGWRGVDVLINDQYHRG